MDWWFFCVLREPIFAIQADRNFSWELIYATLRWHSREAALLIINLYFTMCWVTQFTLLTYNRHITEIMRKIWINAELLEIYCTLYNYWTFSMQYTLFGSQYRLGYVSKLGFLFAMQNCVNLSPMYKSGVFNWLKGVNFCGVLFCGVFFLRELIFADCNPQNSQKS